MVYVWDTSTWACEQCGKEHQGVIDAYCSGCGRKNERFDPEAFKQENGGESLEQFVQRTCKEGSAHEGHRIGVVRTPLPSHADPNPYCSYCGVYFWEEDRTAAPRS